MKKSMVIVAGGSGTRMGAGLPKQFLELNGKPILMHTLKCMHEFDAGMQLVLVLPADEIPFWKDLTKKHGFTVELELANGGNTRFLSVKNGLEKVDGDLIGVHDGVRPFPAMDVMKNCFEMALVHGAAVPTLPVIQSLRQLDDSSSKAVNRDFYRVVQTPQCFQSKILKTAYNNAAGQDFSDDATVVEALGTDVQLVEGNSENIKITNPMDLQLAELIIARRNN